MRAELIDPSVDFVGTFGMPGISQLSTLLNLDEYSADATITVTKKNDDTPTGIHFVNHYGNFENDYRFMSSALVNEKLKTLEFAEPSYEVVLEPGLISIQRLRQQSLANASELLFTSVVEDTNLVFNFGDHSTNSGKFNFAENIDNDKLNKRWAYPVSQVMGILALAGDIEMKFSNVGALVITCNSGLVKYTYILPAQAK
jgi:hypothetical protein